MTARDAFRILVQLPWIVFLVYWIVASIKTRTTRTKESFVSRYSILFIEVVGYVLLFSREAGIGFLGTLFMPRSLAIAILGVILTWLGIGLAIWARYHLAENWSARITIKEDHQLIRTGPYSHLRHPIYSGIILGGDRLRHSHRQVALRAGFLPRPAWLLLKRQKGRSHA